MRLLFILSIILFFSCSGENRETGEVHGKVLNVTTDEPVATATVYLYKGEGGGTFMNPAGYILVAEGRSDANGEFVFYTGEDDHYYARAVKDLYFDGGNHEEKVELGVVTCYLQPSATEMIHIKNVYPFDDYEKIVFDDYYIFGGLDVDTTLYFSVYGNKDNYITWRLYGDDTVFFSDYIFASQFDTAYYEIFY